ncbi:MAG: hypothetical protein ACK5AQ_01995 [Bacteroidota bacterium]
MNFLFSRTNLAISAFLLLILGLPSCGSDSPKNKKTSSEHASIPVVQESPELNDSLKAHKGIHSMARLVAGLLPEQGTEADEITKLSAWKAFSANLNSRFGKLDSTRLFTIRNWREKELASTLSGEEVLFYPFSGPDFLNASQFFPEAASYYMFALEAPGSLPLPADLKKDTSGKYFSSIEKSLWSILNFSFFRTNSMKVDLNASDLNGAVHLLVLFAQRMGYEVYSVQAVTIDSLGKISEGQVGTIPGMRILCLSPDKKQNKTIFYFSADISDAGILGKKELRMFLENLPDNRNTYLKSASYLLHGGNFSWMRAHILRKSHHILQDDSGIPLRYVDSTWQKTFYGSYDAPISLFKNKYQEQLRAAYEAGGSNVRPLPFGIGYDYRLNESNLMLFSKLKGK